MAPLGNLKSSLCSRGIPPKDGRMPSASSQTEPPPVICVLNRLNTIAEKPLTPECLPASSVRAKVFPPS